MTIHKVDSPAPAALLDLLLAQCTASRMENGTNIDEGQCQDCATDDEFSTKHLNDEQRKIAESIVTFLCEEYEKERPYGGGCKAFHTPEQWRARGEQYGLASVLILCHDGGDLRSYCNWDYGQYSAIDAFAKHLASLGYYVEQCTSWYSAIYRLPA